MKLLVPTGISRAWPRTYRHFAPYCCRAYHELSFSKHGEPSDALEYYHQKDMPPIAQSDNITNDYVQVRMLYAPWNPADKNTVQGKYPSPLRQPLSAPPSARDGKWQVAGSEGFGRVSSSSSKFSAGDYVTLGQGGRGTFRSSLWLPEQALIPVKRGRELEERIGSAAASTLFQLGGTAWRLLHDFENNLGGRNNIVVIQNAGNSGVGFMISQLAAARNMNVVSLVRRGTRSQDDFEHMTDTLTQSHANTDNTHVVVAEEDLLQNNDALRSLQSTFAKAPPRLAINAVGGESASVLLKMLAPGGTMVTYGGMSMKPVKIATPQLIFKNLQLRGYWHSRWMAQSFSKLKEQMIEALVNAVLDQNVQCPPVEVFSLSQMHDAFEFEAQQSAQAIRKKIVFACEDEKR